MIVLSDSKEARLGTTHSGCMSGHPVSNSEGPFAGGACGRGTLATMLAYQAGVLCESYIGKPIGTRAVPQCDQRY